MRGALSSTLEKELLPASCCVLGVSEMLFTGAALTGAAMAIDNDSTELMEMVNLFK